MDNHLEQITLSAKTIGDLDFPPPRIFTNALLGHHEITTLIRDTEPHERALFSIDPSLTDGLRPRDPKGTTTFGGDGFGRRRTGQIAPQRQSSAVAKVLGKAMVKQIQQSSRSNGKRAVNIEVLLQGAEKLCSVYSVAGADGRISDLRARHSRIAESIAEYERKVVSQQARLNRMSIDTGADEWTGRDERDSLPTVANIPTSLNENDLRAEEEEIRELEAKKRALEERIAGIEKDLGGLHH